MFFRSSMAGCEMITWKPISAASSRLPPTARLVHGRENQCPQESLHATPVRTLHPRASRPAATGSRCRSELPLSSWANYRLNLWRRQVACVAKFGRHGGIIGLRRGGYGSLHTPGEDWPALV